MSDDADVLYIISRKIANCSINVKHVVFKTYCSCMYTAQLWGTCLSRAMNRLKVAYNDSLRMVLGIPRYRYFVAVIMTGVSPEGYSL